MPFTVNIFDNKFGKKHQNPRFDSKKLLENNQLNTERQSRTPFRMPLSGSRRTIICGPCNTNVKVIKSVDLEESCLKLCYKGNAIVKRSKDGIITNSNFRFTTMEVLERNNKSFNQNEFNYVKPLKVETFYPEDYIDPDLIGLKSGEIYTNDYLLNNTNKNLMIQKPGGLLGELIENPVGFGDYIDPGNNGGLKCSISTYKFSNPKFTSNGGVSAKNVINLKKYNNNILSQINNCKNGEDCNIYGTMNYIDVDNETFCFPNRLNGKKQTCFNPETFEITRGYTVDGMDSIELKNNKGKIINLFLKELNTTEVDFQLDIKNNTFRIRALKQSIIFINIKTINIIKTKGLIHKLNSIVLKESLNKIPGFTIKNVKTGIINESRINQTIIREKERTFTAFFKEGQTTRFNTLKFTVEAHTIQDANVYVYIDNALYGDILNGAPNLKINFDLNETFMNTSFNIRIIQKENNKLKSFFSLPLGIILDSKVSLPVNFKVLPSNPIIKKKTLTIQQQLQISESTVTETETEEVVVDVLSATAPVESINLDINDPEAIQEIIDETIPKIHNTLFLTWDKNLDKDIFGYEIYKNNKLLIRITDPNITKYTDTDLIQRQEYIYTIYNIDNLNNKSKPVSFTAVSPDYKPPDVPKNLKAIKLDSSIQLIWDKIINADDDFQKYVIYLDNVKFDEVVEVETTTYTVKNLTNYKNYTLNITAVDNLGNESEKSNSVTTNSVDLTPPNDININDITIIEGNKSLTFRWPYNSDVNKYNIFQDKGLRVADNSLNLIAIWNNDNVGGDFFENTLLGLKNWNKYKFVIKSIDDRGNVSRGITPKTKDLIYSNSTAINITPDLISNDGDLITMPANYNFSFDFLFPKINTEKHNILFLTKNKNFDEKILLYSNWNTQEAWERFGKMVIEKSDTDLSEEDSKYGITGIKRRYNEDRKEDGKDSDTLIVLPYSPAYNLLTSTTNYNEILTNPKYFINNVADWNKLSYNNIFGQIQAWGKYIFNNNSNGLFYRKFDEEFDWIKLANDVKDFSVSKDTYDLSQNEFCIFTINSVDTIDVIDFKSKENISVISTFSDKAKKVSFLSPHLLIIADDNNIKYSKRGKDPTWTTLGCCYFTDVKISEFGGKIIIIGYNTVASYYWKYTNDILNGTWELIQDTEGLVDDKTKYLNLSIGTYLYLYNDNDELKETLKIIGGGSASGNIYLEGDAFESEGSLKWDDDDGKLYFNKTAFDRIIHNRKYHLRSTGKPYRSLNQQQCQDYATTTTGKTFHSVNNWDTKPPGCAEHPPTGRVFFNTQGDNNECNEGGHACVELNEGVEFYEKTSGPPDGNMTEQECYAEAARQGITNASAWDWNGWPNGCAKVEKDQFRWNTTGTVDCGTSGVPCIQKRTIKGAEWIEYNQTFNKLIDNHYIKTKKISGKKNILGKFKKISLEKNHLWGIDNNDNLNYSIIKNDNGDFKFEFIKIEGGNVTDLSVTDNGMCIYVVIDEKLYRKMEDDEGDPSWKYLFKSSFIQDDFPIEDFLRLLLTESKYGDLTLMVNITKNQTVELITQTMMNKFIHLESIKKLTPNESVNINIRVVQCGETITLFCDNTKLIDEQIDLYRSSIEEVNIYSSSKNTKKLPVFELNTSEKIFENTTQRSTDEFGNEQENFGAPNDITKLDPTSAAKFGLNNNGIIEPQVNNINLIKIYSPIDNVAPNPPDLSGIPQNYKINVFWNRDINDDGITYYNLYKNDKLLKKYALQDKVIFEYNRKLDTDTENNIIKKGFTFPYNYEFKYSVTFNKTQMKGSCLFRIANVDKDVAVGARFISNFFSSGKNRIEINTGVIPKEGESLYWTNVQRMVPIELHIKYDITITFRENSRTIVVINTSSNETTTYKWSAGNRIRGSNEDRKDCYFMLSDTRFWGRKKSDFILENVSLKEIKYYEDVTNDKIEFIDEYVDARENYVYEVDVQDTLNISNKKKISLTPLDQMPPKTVTITIITGDRNIKLDWEHGADKDVKEYTFFRRDQKQDEQNWNDWKQIGSQLRILESIYEDDTIINGKLYQYYLTITDFTGNVSKPSNIVQGKGTRNPEIFNFKVKAGNQQSVLSWNKSISGIFSSYIIDRTPDTNANNHSVLTTTAKLDFPITIQNVNVTKFVDYSLQNGIEYTYSIIELGNDGRKSLDVVKSITCAANLNNDFGESFSFNRTEAELNKLTIYWPPSTSEFFKQYRIYINRTDKQALYIPTFLPTAVNGETRYTFRNLINDRKYSLQLLVLDNQLRIINCYLFNGTPIDNPPSTPKNISITAASDQIKLEWQINTEQDISGYMIYRDDNFVSLVRHPNNIYIDRNVVLGKSYKYNIISFDNGGNSSKKSSDINTRPEEVPGAPLKIIDFKVISLKNKLTLEFSKNKASDLKFYNVYRKKGTTSRSNTIYSRIEKDGEKYFQKQLIDYSNHSHSNLKRGGLIVDRPEPAFWKGNLNDTGWLGEVLDGMPTIKKNSIDYNSHWIEFDLSGSKEVTGINMQHVDLLRYVTKIAIKASIKINNWDNEDWIEITPNKTDKDFNQPLDKNEIIRLLFPNIITCRYFRIYILTFNEEPGLRVEFLYNCIKGNKIIFNDEGLINTENYEYSVTAEDIYGQESLVSNSIISQPVDPFPGAPTIPLNLTSSYGNSKVILNWNKNNEGDIWKYYIYKKVADAEFVLAYKVNEEITNYTETDSIIQFIDTNVTNDIEYTYKITAVDTDIQESNQSTITTVTPTDDPPRTPSNFKLYKNNRKVRMSWDKNTEEDFKQYNIYKGFGAAEVLAFTVTDVNSVNVNDTIFFNDTNVVNGTNYYYKITAVDNANQESNKSTQLEMIPEDLPPKPPEIESIKKCDEYLTLKLKLNLDDTDIVKYKLNRDGSTKQEFTNNSYISVLPKTSYAVSSFTIDDGITYDDPRLSQYASNYFGWKPLVSENSYMEITIPDADSENVILGIAIRGLDADNYPKKLKIFTSKTFNVTTTNSELMDDNKDFSEGIFDNTTTHRLLFKNPKTNIKKIKIDALPDGWNNSFAFSCGIIFQFSFINQYHFYNDYNLVNDNLYTYEFIAQDESINVARSVNKTARPYDCFPPDPIKIINITNQYKSVTLNWETSLDKSFKHYTLYKNNKKLLNTTKNSHTDTDILNNINYRYEISVTDQRDNESGRSAVTIGKSELPILQNIRLYNKTHNTVTVESNTLTVLDDKVRYKIYYYEKGKDYQNPIENDNPRIIIQNLKGDTEYGFRMTSLVDGIESKETAELLIRTNRTPTSSLSKVTNFSYDMSNNTIPRRIKLIWESNTIDWDLKGYLITIKKGTGIIAIANMKNIFLTKEINTYVINNFDWDTLYEIKIYSQSNNELLSEATVINFTSNQDPNIVLNQNTQKLIDKIADNVALFTIKQLEDLKNEVDSFGTPHNDLKTEFDDAVALIVPRINTLKNNNDTQEKINKIQEGLFNDDLIQLKKINTDLKDYTPSSVLTTDYNNNITDLETRIRDKEWINETNAKITKINTSMNEADITKDVTILESIKKEITEYNPHSSLTLDYETKETEYLNKILDINLYNTQKTDTLNKTKLLTNSINDTLTNINALLKSVEAFIPLSDGVFTENYNTAKTNLENKKNELIAFETEKIKWLSAPTRKRSIHKQLSKNWLEWEKEENDLIIEVLGIDSNMYFQFDLLQLDKYFGSVLLRNQDQIVMNVDIIRKINNYYTTIRKQVRVKLFAEKLKTIGTAYGTIHKDPNLGTNTPNIFKVGDLITTGNSWKLNNIFNKIYTFDDIDNNTYKWSGDINNNIIKQTNNYYIKYIHNIDGNIELNSNYYNNYSKMDIIKIFNTVEQTKITNSETVTDTGNVQVSENDIGMGWKVKTINLNNYSLRIPSSNTDFSTGITQTTKPVVNARSISFWIKNWNSTKLIYTESGDLVDAINKTGNISSAIRKFTDEKGNNYRNTTGQSNFLNIWGLNQWKFVYIEFKATYTFTSDGNRQLYFNYNDGDVSMCNIQFYNNILSTEQLDMISKNDVTYYSLWKKIAGAPNKIFTLIHSNKFYNNDINDGDTWYITRKKKKYDLDDGDKTKFSYEEWDQEYGKFNDRINNDSITINGFTNADDAKKAAELYPTCVGVSRFDNKYYLMKNSSTYDSKQDWINREDGEYFVPQENWRGNRTVKRLSWKYNISNNTQHGWEKMIKLASKNETFLKEYISNDVFNVLNSSFSNLRKNQMSYFIFPLTNNGIYGKLKSRGVTEIDVTEWPSLGSNYKTKMNTGAGTNLLLKRNTVLISSGVSGLKQKWVEQIINEVFKNKLIFFKYYFEYDEIPDSFNVGILFNYTYMLSNFPHNELISDLST